MHIYIYDNHGLIWFSVLLKFEILLIHFWLTFFNFLYVTSMTSHLVKNLNFIVWIL